VAGVASLEAHPIKEPRLPLRMRLAGGGVPSNDRFIELVDFPAAGDSKTNLYIRIMCDNVPRATMHIDTSIKAGVIEGFFGHPWAWPARLSAAEFLRDFGYQFYIYAPKADPFQRRRWREPLPTETLQQLSELHTRCQELGVSLGIGLTPVEIYLNYDANARMSLRSKVSQINEVGVEMLCILFDDMRGDVDELSDLQARVIANVCGWSNAYSLIVCPTYDSRLARQFGSPAKSYLRDFARIIDPSIDILWTGEQVISDGYSAKHLVDVANEIGRKPFIWDNHAPTTPKFARIICFLIPRPAHGNFPSILWRASLSTR
jgi:hypothetical protein